MNLIRQQSCYLHPEHGLEPTDEETLTFYSESTGWNRDDPSTDQGSVVMGKDGVMQYWFDKGIIAGGKQNKVTAYLAMDPRNARHLRQSLEILGGALVGIGFPTNLMNQPEIPFVWEDMSGPRAGHEIYLPGTYETVGSEIRYDLISWNEPFRISELALMEIIEEAVAVFDDAFIDARGLNAAAMPKDKILASMQALRV